MKRSILLIIAGILWLPTVFGQGVDFFNGTFQQAVEKAAAESKYVILDCYTDWCGPCKRMNANVFPQEEVGNYVNSGFVFLKSDMEKGEGLELRKRFNVKAYPTFIVFDATGNEIHRWEGGASAKDFLLELREALGEIPAFDELTKRYNGGERDKKFLCEYLDRAPAKLQYEKVMAVAEELMSMLSDDEKTSPEYWFLFESYVFADSDGERYLIENKDKFLQTIGEEKVRKHFVNVCVSDYSHMIFFIRDKPVTEIQLATAAEKAFKLGVHNMPLVVLYEAGAKMCADNDADALLDTFEQVSDHLDSSDIDHFISLIEMSLVRKFSTDQKERLTSLIETKRQSNK